MHARMAMGAALALVMASEPLAAQDIEPVGEPLDVALKTGPLTPETVLRSSRATFPSILESFEREAAARGDQLAAERFRVDAHAGLEGQAVDLDGLHRLGSDLF